MPSAARACVVSSSSPGSSFRIRISLRREPFRTTDVFGSLGHARGGGPRGEHLLLLAYYSDDVFEAILALTERDRNIAKPKLRTICDEMTKSLRIFRDLMEGDG